MDNPQGVECPFLWAILVPGDFEHCRKTVASVIKKHARDCDLDDVDPRKLGQYLGEIRGAENYHAFGLRHDAPADLADLEEVFAQALSEQVAGTVFSLTLWTEERVFAYQGGNLCDEEPDVPPYTLARKKGCPLRPKQRIARVHEPTAVALCLVSGQSLRTVRSWVEEEYRGSSIGSDAFLFSERRTGVLVYSARVLRLSLLDALVSMHPEARGYDIFWSDSMSYFSIGTVNHDVEHNYVFPMQPHAPLDAQFLGETDPKRILEKLDIPQEIMDLPRTYERDEFEVD